MSRGRPWARWLRGLAALGLGGWLALPGRAAPACPPEPQAPGAAQAEQARGQARDRGFLWRLTRDGRVSHLYGTLHVGRLEWVFPGPTVQAAFARSEVLALELDLLDPAVMADVQEGLLPRPGAAPALPVPDDLARRLKAQVEAACLSDAVRQQLLDSPSPELVMTTLTVLSARSDGLEAAYAVDLVLSRLGHQAGKAVVSLEDPSMQMGLLSAGSPEQLREDLEAGLAGLESRSAQRGMRRVARLWAESDFEALARYPSWCECMDTPAQRELMKKVLDDRNLALAERIDALHAGGRSVFAAVGSLHMVGPLGLPQTMARRGYRVERIELARRRR